MHAKKMDWMKKVEAVSWKELDEADADEILAAYARQPNCGTITIRHMIDGTSVMAWWGDQEPILAPDRLTVLRDLVARGEIAVSEVRRFMNKREKVYES